MFVASLNPASSALLDGWVGEETDLGYPRREHGRLSVIVSSCDRTERAQQPAYSLLHPTGFTCIKQSKLLKHTLSLVEGHTPL